MTDGGLSDRDLEDLARAPFQHALTQIDKFVDVDAVIAANLSPTFEAVRFRASRLMAFSAGDIASIRRVRGLIEVRVNFLGLYGPSSPLPPHYSEIVAQSDRDADAVEDFFDFFDHRLIALLRRLWHRWQYRLRYRTGAADPLSARLLCLAGLPIPAAGTDPGVSPDAEAGDRALLLPQLGLLALYSRSAVVLGTILTRFFEVPVGVREFTPREVEIPPDQREPLGGGRLRLGRNVIAGRMVPDRLGKYTVVVGPVSLAQFRRFLPSGPEFPRLVRMIELTQTEPLEWELDLVLIEGQAPAMRLGASELGWTTFLPGGPRASAPVRVSVARAA